MGMLSRNAILALSATLCICAPAWAAELAYPFKPVRIIVGFPPGGTADILARALAREMSEAWGQQFVVDNRPGAGSRVGSELVSKAAPDGYTLLVVTSSHVVNAVVSRESGYDAVESFTPISMIAGTALGVLSNPSLPVKSVRELIAFAKPRPGQLHFGSSGTASTTHLAGELISSMAGIKLVHVSYKGGVASLNDVLGGQIPLLMISWPTSIPQVKSGRLRGLGITARERSKALPEVPTVAESGLTGYEAVQWYALLGPAGLSAELTGRLNAEVARIVRAPKVVDPNFVANMGADPMTSSAQEFRAYMQSEVVKWSKVARQIALDKN